MRVLGVDYGTKNIGIAVSDALGIGARGVETLRGLADQSAIERLTALIGELQVDVVVVGLPVGEDGTEGDAAARIRRFAERLAQGSPVPVETIGERLTSFEAEERMKGMGIRGEERRRRIDEVAATIIVEEFLANRAARGW